MWTATIKEKSFDNGAFVLNVNYSDGANRNFNEVCRLQLLSDLDGVVASRLNLLNTSDSLDSAYPVGTFSPQIQKQAIYIPNPFDAIIGTLSNLTNLITLGVIDKTHPDYIQALQAAKDAYKK